MNISDINLDKYEILKNGKRKTHKGYRWLYEPL